MRGDLKISFQNYGTTIKVELMHLEGNSSAIEK
jgi:hypothetical protein